MGMVVWFSWHLRDQNFLEHSGAAWMQTTPSDNHPVLNIAVLYFYLIPSSANNSCTWKYIASTKKLQMTILGLESTLP